MGLREAVPGDGWRGADVNEDVRLYLGDCLDVLRTLPDRSVDAVVTDPPYLTGDARVPIRGHGVVDRQKDSVSVGLPWGYSLDWLHAVARLRPHHWVVFCNYRMLGGICSMLEQYAEVSTVFTWRKSNAPRMTRPVPRLDTEFIVWARAKGATCGRMGEFESAVLDVPMPQAGCFASERILAAGSGKAAHPCQKPIAVVRPFIDRLPVATVLDPFMGSGTTGIACIQTGRRFIGIEIEPAYYAIAEKRIAEAQMQQMLPLVEQRHDQAPDEATGVAMPVFMAKREENLSAE